MKIAFTICSVNYLAQARTLGDSLRMQNPDIRFIIGLVDKLETKNLPSDKLPQYEMLPIDQIQIDDFEAICQNYNITELNTAVKPFYFSYFYKHFPEAQHVIYFDPDIIVFQPLTRLFQSLSRFDAVLTPHTNSPYNDNLWQNEEDLNNAGIYNLGFIGTSRSNATLEFVKWWEQKLRHECLIDLKNGLFVDQHWVDFLPVFWDNIEIDSYPGYNVAYWNLHERAISKQNDTWLINGEPLVFFHYSGYSPKKPKEVSKYQNRILFENRNDIVELFELYHNSLLKNDQAFYEPIPCDYIKPQKVERLVKIRKFAKAPFEALAQLLD